MGVTLRVFLSPGTSLRWLCIRTRPAMQHPRRCPGRAQGGVTGAGSRAARGPAGSGSGGRAAEELGAPQSARTRRCPLGRAGPAPRGPAAGRCWPAGGARGERGSGVGGARRGPPGAGARRGKEGGTGEGPGVPGPRPLSRRAPRPQLLSGWERALAAAFFAGEILPPECATQPLLASPCLRKRRSPSARAWPSGGSSSTTPTAASSWGARRRAGVRAAAGDRGGARRRRSRGAAGSGAERGRWGGRAGAGCGGAPRGDEGPGWRAPSGDEGTGCGRIAAGMRGRRTGEAARAAVAAHAPRCPLQPLV